MNEIILTIGSMVKCFTHRRNKKLEQKAKEIIEKTKGRNYVVNDYRRIGNGIQFPDYHS